MTSSNSSALSLDELAQLAESDELAVELDREYVDRHGLSGFIELGWHVIEPAELVWGWHQAAICEHLEAQTRGDIRNLIINVPPRSSKSTIVSVMWPAWEWIEHPERRWTMSSYSSSLSLDLALLHRRVVESEWYRARWPHVVLAQDQLAKSKFDTTAGGYRISTSTDGTITGKGGDRLVADDPHNTREAESEVVRESVINWWRRTFASRANDAKKVTRTIVMQRVHERDLAGVLLEDGGWEHLCLPQEFEVARRCTTSLGVADKRTEEGELLQPARFDHAEVAQAKKDLGTYAYAGQHQQRPAPAEGGLFKAQWWRFWRWPWEAVVPELAARTVERPLRFSRKVLSWDCAFKETKDSDYVAGGVWGEDGANVFLLDMEWERMDFPKTLAALKAQAAKNPDYDAILVEDKANGPAVIAMLKKENELHSVIEVEPEGGKEARAQATAPQTEAGNVFLPLHAPWRDEYISEHSAFPKGSNDDAVDQQSQYLLWRRKRLVDYEGQSGNLPKRRM